MSLPPGIEITLLPKIGGHGDVVRKLYQARLEMPDIANSQHNDASGVHWSHGAVVARISSEIVGLISFDIQEHSQSMFICTGWVNDFYRRQGIYSTMFYRTESFAKEKGLLRIIGATSYNNHAMQSTMKKLGRKPVAIIYEMDIAND
jgi:RimJ/RimL family protein N-acetyltransferase